MATIDYLYGTPFFDSERRFQCFGTANAFKIKSITKYDNTTLTTFFWSIISKIEVFFKVKITGKWVILTISTDKNGDSRERVLANKNDIIQSLGLVFDEVFYGGEEPYEHKIEYGLYNKQFPRHSPESRTPTEEALTSIAQTKSLWRDLRYTGILSTEFEIAFSEFKALQEAITKAGDLAYPRRGTAYAQQLAYSEFLARVICRKCELEQETSKEMTYDFSTVAYDETGQKFTISEADVLKPTGARAPSRSSSMAAREGAHSAVVSAASWADGGLASF